MSVVERLFPGADEDTGRFVVVTAALAALNGLLFGFDTGVISGAMLYIRDTFDLTALFGYPLASSTVEGLIVSGAMAGAIVGAALGGRLADRLGRRRLILVGAVIFFAGSLLMTIAPTVEILIVGRVLDGLGIGFASVVGPLYISEIAPPKIRGSLVTFNQIMITGGIFVSYLTNYALASLIVDAELSWRLMLGVGMVPALVLLVGIHFLPESPRWLVERDREQRARSVLGRIRNGTDIDAEVREIKRVAAIEEDGFRELLKPWIRPVMIVGLGLAIFQQATGINAVVYYAPTILEASGYSDTAAIFGTIGVGAINVGLSIVAALLLDRVGRRPLLLVGLVGMFVTLAVLGGAYYLPGMSGLIGPIAVASLMLFVAGHALSLGPVFWLLISEIYPLNVRGAAMGVVTLVLWLSNFLVAQLFPSLFEIGPTVAFWSFAGVTAAAFAFAYVFVPETKGRSLEEIEADLRETAVTGDELSIADRADRADD
ncbi:sugar porter family MFS transporter [Natrinema salifodinae]|uniref:MFS transporter, sugar porter (SP) family n=1 Tax=Natrinema salifodinae TaxID=1202768 RepID=A0A1I0QTG0_9EURY|nr:sugar porter family MFS transporter [Natrinema salifodinae]SEW30904.1 MFS transporter, sugar porter (SP) family [Natrinema salifodinae]